VTTFVDGRGLDRETGQVEAAKRSRPDAGLASRPELFSVRATGTGWAVVYPGNEAWAKPYGERALAVAALAAAVRQIFGGNWTLARLIAVEEDLPKHGYTYVAGVQSGPLRIVQISDAVMEHVRQALGLTWAQANSSLRRAHFLGLYLDSAMIDAVRRWKTVAPAFSSRELARQKLSPNLVFRTLNGRSEREILVQAARSHRSTRGLVRAFERDRALSTGARRAGPRDFSSITASRWAEIILALLATVQRQMEIASKEYYEKLRLAGMNAFLAPYEIQVDNPAKFILRKINPLSSARLSYYGSGYVVRGGQQVSNARNEPLFLLTVANGQAIYLNEKRLKFYRQSLPGLENELIYGVFTQVAEKTRDIIPITEFILNVTGALFPPMGYVFKGSQVMSVAGRLHRRRAELLRTYRRLHIAARNIEARVPGLLEAVAIAALGQLAAIVRFHLAPAWDAWFIVALKVSRKSLMRPAVLGSAPSATASMLSESWTRLAGSWRRILPTGTIVLASIKSVEVRLGSPAGRSRRPVPAVQALMAAKLKEIGVAGALPLAIRIASLHSVEAESFFNEIAELVESGDTMIRLVKEITAW
jgi:hypothetical protein